MRTCRSRGLINGEAGHNLSWRARAHATRTPRSSAISSFRTYKKGVELCEFKVFHRKLSLTLRSSSICREYSSLSPPPFPRGKFHSAWTNSSSVVFTRLFAWWGFLCIASSHSRGSLTITTAGTKDCAACTTPPAGMRFINMCLCPKRKKSASCMPKFSCIKY